jgi:dTDP-4-dehydrorhamnose 3,5-epimerase
MERIEHKTFKDNRGSYTPVLINTLGIDWTQCSVSVNDNKFTFRGLHYQIEPPQTKYVKVIRGSIIDFAVDLKTKKVESIVLGENDAVFVENDKAHGFLTLEPDTIVLYLSQGEYNPQSEHSIPWLEIEDVRNQVLKYVGKSPLTISEKDTHGTDRKNRPY